MAQRSEAIRDFIRHSRRVNYYTNKQGWDSLQVRHYHRFSNGMNPAKPMT